MTYKGLDSFRFFAFLSVFLYHVGVLPAGYVGVLAFFVLSGFLLTRFSWACAASSRRAATSSTSTAAGAPDLSARLFLPGHGGRRRRGCPLHQQPAAPGRTDRRAAGFCGDVYLQLFSRVEHLCPLTVLDSFLVVGGGRTVLPRLAGGGVVRLSEPVAARARRVDHRRAGDPTGGSRSVHDVVRELPGAPQLYRNIYVLGVWRVDAFAMGGSLRCSAAHHRAPSLPGTRRVW